MKLRCPYCKEVFGPEPASTCPHCGKGMIIPDRLLKRPYRERKKLKDKIGREAEKKRIASFPAGRNLGRQPTTVFILLAIMFLAGAALLSRTGSGQKSTRIDYQTSVARQELKTLRIAIERFRRDCSRYPNPNEGLRALVLNPDAPGWNGPYVNIVKPDPWHTPYGYSVTNDSIVLVSHGPDGNAATGDEIFSDPPSSEDVAR